MGAHGSVAFPLVENEKVSDLAPYARYGNGSGLGAFGVLGREVPRCSRYEIP